MPMLDLSDVASDPELMSEIVRLRPTVVRVPGTEGRARKTYASTPLLAIVQPGDRPDELESVPDGERMSNWITVICTEGILLAGPETISDIVVYAGSNYRVVKVEPFQAYGYCLAMCEEYHKAVPTQPAPTEDEG